MSTGNYVADPDYDDPRSPNYWDQEPVPIHNKLDFWLINENDEDQEYWMVIEESGITNKVRVVQVESKASQLYSDDDVKIAIEESLKEYYNHNLIIEHDW